MIFSIKKKEWGQTDKGKNATFTVNNFSPHKSLIQGILSQTFTYEGLQMELTSYCMNDNSIIREKNLLSDIGGKMWNPQDTKMNLTRSLYDNVLWKQRNKYFSGATCSLLTHGTQRNKDCVSHTVQAPVHRAAACKVCFCVFRSQWHTNYRPSVQKTRESNWPTSEVTVERSNIRITYDEQRKQHNHKRCVRCCWLMEPTQSCDREQMSFSVLYIGRDVTLCLPQWWHTWANKSCKVLKDTGDTVLCLLSKMAWNCYC